MHFNYRPRLFSCSLWLVVLCFPHRDAHAVMTRNNSLLKEFPVGFDTITGGDTFIVRSMGMKSAHRSSLFLDTHRNPAPRVAWNCTGRTVASCGAVRSRKTHVPKSKVWNQGLNRSRLARGAAWGPLRFVAACFKVLLWLWRTNKKTEVKFALYRTFICVLFLNWIL